MENENKNNSNEKMDIEVPRKSPINLILIGLIIVVIIMLAVQFFNMKNISNNYDDLLNNDTQSPTEIVKPEPVKLSTELFDSEVINLDFSDITLGIENEDIRTFYLELVDDMSNFVQVYDKTFMPSDNIFELKFKDTKTSIFFFNEIFGEKSYCSVVHNGEIVGYYLIPVTYYGNLFNVVHSSPDITSYTRNLLVEDIESLIGVEAEYAIKLDDSHVVIKNGNQLDTFEVLIKNRENATMMYGLSNDTYVIISYMNFKYYVFVTNAAGEILQEGSYKHYSLLEDNYLHFYNISATKTTEKFLMDGDCLSLKVVK